VTSFPASLVFDADDVQQFQSTTVRVTIDVTDSYRYESAYVTDADCRDVFTNGCPRYEIADAAPVRVGNVDVIRLFGSVPNARANGTLVRSDRASASSLRAVIIYRNASGGRFSTGSAPFPAFSAERARVDAPNTIERGGSLTVRALTERFDRSWVDNPREVQLQFQSGGTGGFAPVGAAQTTNAEGETTFVVPAVGTAGDWRVVARGAAGQTVVSNQVTVGFAAAPPATPSAPIVTLNRASRTSLFFNVSPPAVGAPLVEYRWSWERSSGGGGGSRVVAAGAQPDVFEIAGLAPNTAYDVTVRAVNASGAGEAGRASGRTEAVPPSVNPPSQPRITGGSAGNHRVTVRWAAPLRTGGARIDRYQVHRRGANKIVGGSVRSASFSGLVNGRTYTLFVRAHNRAGYGAWSRAVLLRPHR
jgi:hypothetical protein